MAVSSVGGRGRSWGSLEDGGLRGGMASQITSLGSYSNSDT